MALTKDQILAHALGLNLFRTRGNNIVRVTFYDTNPSDSNYPIAVTHLTGEDQGYIHGLTAEGNDRTDKKESEYDLVALITADDLQQLTKPDKQPASKPKFNIDLKQCMEDQTYLKTRNDEKAIILKHNPYSDNYPFIGVIIETDGILDVVTWTKDGRYTIKDRNSLKDIVGLWEGTDGR